MTVKFNSRIFSVSLLLGIFAWVIRYALFGYVGFSFAAVSCARIACGQFATQIRMEPLL